MPDSHVFRVNAGAVLVLSLWDEFQPIYMAVTKMETGKCIW